ncbi:MAG: FprA family A-type flavoprotein [Chloroflexi bacterium]|nr:FprA family A-type flavoprotein [Chloroflexota bacterium]
MAKKVLIAYFSLAGNTEKMAEFIAEGVRFSSNQAVLKKISEIKNAADLEGYDGYIFGSPTYFLDIPEPVKTFLFLGRKADLKSKLAGAFGSYTHDGNAPGMVLDTMQYVFNMEPFELGVLKLKEHELAIYDRHNPSVEATEKMRACQDYGRVFGEKLGK